MKTICETDGCPNKGRVANRSAGQTCGMCKKPPRVLNPPPSRRGYPSSRRIHIVPGIVIQIN